MVAKGFPLIKIQSSKRIESLQSGLLYMNTLEWFRKHESEDGDEIIGDSFEGMFHINDGEMVFPDMGEKIEIKNELIKTANSDDYAFCMLSINPNTEEFRFTDEQKEKLKKFGEKALVILDQSEFFRRIQEAALKKGYIVYGNMVNYYDESKDNVKYFLSLLSGMHNVGFWKRKSYYYQQEYRFIVHAPNESADHLELHIGNISDISQVLDTETLLNATVVENKGK